MHSGLIWAIPDNLPAQDPLSHLPSPSSRGSTQGARKSGRGCLLGGGQRGRPSSSQHNTFLSSSSPPGGPALCLSHPPPTPNTSPAVAQKGAYRVLRLSSRIKMSLSLTGFPTTSPKTVKRNFPHVRVWRIFPGRLSASMMEDRSS